MRRFGGIIAIVGLVIALAGAARASDGLSKDYSDCMEKSGGATPAMQACIEGELAAQDRKLNATYGGLMRSGSDKRKAALRDAQRKWIAYRDANCALYDDGSGGQAARIAANECTLRMTARRAAELDDLKSSE